MTTLVRDESTKIPNPRKRTEMAFAFDTSEEDDVRFPLSPTLIAKEQKKDKALLKAMKASASGAYDTMELEDVHVITYQGKVYVPVTLRSRILAWYHQYLVHPGAGRMEATLRQTLTWPNLQQDVKRHVRTCRKCQLCKKQRKKYGHLPLKEAEKPEPWNRVNIDMVGPYTVQTPTKTHTLRALTMIDPATGWFEIKDISNATAHECMKAFDDVWLARYPRPQYLGYDNGNEYKAVFDELRINYHMKRKRSTEYNPQSNGIVERVHQVLGDMLRTFELEERELDETDPWSEFLSAAAYAIRSTVHTTLEASPAQLVYGRDMFLPIKFEADWQRIRNRRQAEMTRNNNRENRLRIPHEYKVGDQVLVQRPGTLRKMTTPRQGPYKIVQVNTNGTIRIQRGVVTETINIRRVTPFIDTNDAG